MPARLPRRRGAGRRARGTRDRVVHTVATGHDVRPMGSSRGPRRSGTWGQAPVRDRRVRRPSRAGRSALARVCRRPPRARRSGLAPEARAGDRPGTPAPTGPGTLVVRSPFREAAGRAHLALADLAGARMLMGQTGELLEHRLGLETCSVRVRLSGPGSPSCADSAPRGASPLNAAELRSLATAANHVPVAAHRSAPSYPCPAPPSSHRRCRSTAKPDAKSCNQAITQARDLGLLEG